MTDKEIVKELRKQIRIRTLGDRGGTNLLIVAADTIERQAARIAELEGELDEAVDDIENTCSTCGKREGWKTCKEAAFISDGGVCLNWQWRGAD